MNPFRIAILILLSLSLGLLFYIVAFFIPQRQENFAHYQTTARVTEFELRNSEHEARMKAIASSSPLDEAKKHAEEAAKLRRAEIALAEERSVLASALKKEQEAKAAPTPAVAPEPAAEPVQVIIGEVVSYDPQWSSLMIKPNEGVTVEKGTRIAIRRNEGIIQEGNIDGKDQVSGQLAASLIPQSIGGNAEAYQVKIGDQVIISPFKSSQELLHGSSMSPGSSSPQADYPKHPGTQGPSHLPDVAVPFTPVP